MRAYLHKLIIFHNYIMKFNLKIIFKWKTKKYAHFICTIKKFHAEQQVAAFSTSSTSLATKKRPACLTRKMFVRRSPPPCFSFFMWHSLDRPGSILFLGLSHVEPLSTILLTLPSLKQRRSTPTTRRNQCRIWRLILRRNFLLLIFGAGSGWYFAPIRILHICTDKKIKILMHND